MPAHNVTKGVCTHSHGVKRWDLVEFDRKKAMEIETSEGVDSGVRWPSAPCPLDAACLGLAFPYGGRVAHAAAFPFVSKVRVWYPGRGWWWVLGFTPPDI